MLRLGYGEIPSPNDELVIAIARAQLGMVDLWLRHGATAHHGALLVAIEHGDHCFVQLLLRRGADVDANNSEALRQVCL
jgi:ankyrin repeat protein